MRGVAPISSLCLAAAISAALLLSAAAPAPPQRLADLARVRLVDGALQFDWLGSQLPPEKPLLVAGPEAPWSIRSPRPLRGVPPGSLELMRAATGTRDVASFWWIAVAWSPDRLSITAHRGGRVAMETTLRFTHSAADGTELLVRDNFNRTFTRARAPNLIELRNRHPLLVRQCLVPLLRQIAGHDPLLPGATDVYRVFDEVSPDPAAADAVESLLPRLRDPSYPNRQQASAQLAALGAPGVLAVLRMDREQLHPEQQVRLENLLSIHSHRNIADLEAARRDPALLADCLEFQADARIRWLAKARLENILNKPIPLHASPTESEWSAAADLVRARLATTR